MGVVYAELALALLPSSPSLSLCTAALRVFVSYLWLGLGLERLYGLTAARCRGTSKSHIGLFSALFDSMCFSENAQSLFALIPAGVGVRIDVLAVELSLITGSFDARV